MSTQHHLDATTKTWKRSDTPRPFLLKFDQSKLRSANPVKRLDYQVKHDLWGVLFPNGAVSLERDFVNYYRTLSELEESFNAIGRYTITWLDEEEETDG